MGLQKALMLSLKIESLSFDFPEDALQNYCALSGGVKAIITRNIKDYSKSTLSIHTPESYLRIIKEKLKKE